MSRHHPVEQSLKLLHFDMPWLFISPMRLLTFYDSPRCSESHFSEFIVPTLKNSLSLALKYYAPFARKILIPRQNNNEEIPVLRYVDGEDYLPLTIAVSNADFEYLTANHSREAVELHDLVPRQLPPPLPDSSSKRVKLSVAAFQVTLFPNRGVCIGVVGSHSLCDAATLLGFLRTWAAANRSNGDVSPRLLEYLPDYDRDVVEGGYRLAKEFWEMMKVNTKEITTTPSSLSLSTQRIVRATFVLSEAGIKALATRAFPNRVSTFVLAIAHLWSCIVRSATAAGEEEVGDDEAEYFMCIADCRRLLNPPLPSNYFGNCLALVLAESTRGKLRRKGSGFLDAAEAIGEAIRNVVENDDPRGILDVSYRTMQQLKGMGALGKRRITLSGSPRIDYYSATDYGWGRLVKIESLGDDHRAPLLFITKSRDHRGGMEIALSMPEPQMEACVDFFNEGLIPTDQKLLCCKM